MDSCDVLIVGGGPAGSSCAWALRSSGLDVIILDREVFPRDKTCGGWVTPDVFAKLQIDAAQYANGRVLQNITGFRTGCIDTGGAVETDFGQPVSYGIRRREFDDYLLRRSGARVIEGTPLSRLVRSTGHWIINDQITARLVIGAGGHFCPVARLIGAKAGSEPAVVAQEVEFPMDAGQIENTPIRSETPELYFCSDMKGYGWCFRKGNLLNVGLGRADPHRLSAHVTQFLNFLKSSGRLCSDIPTMHGHAYLLFGTSAREVTGDGFLLIGDAAGLAYMQSGEGILPAIESGLMAATTIMATAGKYDTSHLASYREMLKGEFGTPQREWIPQIGRHLPASWMPSIARRLLHSEWFVRDVILKRWFLHSN